MEETSTKIRTLKKDIDRLLTMRAFFAQEGLLDLTPAEKEKISDIQHKLKKFKISLEILKKEESELREKKKEVLEALEKLKIASSLEEEKNLIKEEKIKLQE